MSAGQVDVNAILERGRSLATPVMREAVGRLAAPMDTVGYYHFGWADADGNPITGSGGKGLRPAMALLSAQVPGADPKVGVPGAVAVELIHNFSLLHDDLMDGDEQRHHRATVWKVHGPEQAILVGDAMFALANEVLIEYGGSEALRALRRLTSATRALIDGQAQDLSFEKRDRVSVEECLAMEGNKTSALLACSASIGAVLGGAPDEHADALERYGWDLGLAFQAVDDLLGIWGDTAVTGKPSWGDLRQRKKSLPVVAALAAGGPASDELARILSRPAEEEETEEQLAARARLIEEAGGRRWTQQEAERRHRAALAALDDVPMDAEVRAAFVALAEFVVVREK